ncbi:unnamed protein product [Microthlaspi erraticum]|uniref:Uncharacterized protein n=1 Tax=Microthlaspi erraticum TaxID=1685480 RepID=A0A6D2LBH5_9BRAS|nr:unnamed protein product [Microthlaspi erraticum]
MLEEKDKEIPESDMNLRRKLDEGRPLRKELEHSRSNSEMTDIALDPPSQSHADRGISQMSVVAGLQIVWSRQCHVGYASVKTVMNICCESKERKAR